MKKNKRIRDWIFDFFIFLLLILGTGMLLYPTVADQWNQRHMSGSIAEYENIIAANSDDENEALRLQADQYNKQLLNASIDRFFPSNAMHEEYLNTLSINANGIMGSVTIPKIHVSLPIFHGTDDITMEAGIGHIEGTSLPVGGLSTHTVLTGHTGMASSTLFTNLHKLEIGDVFELNILGRKLFYLVDFIQVVEPDDMNSLAIEPNRDYATLVTCTPYGINSHRLLVRGRRYSGYPEFIQELPEDPTPIMIQSLSLLGASTGTAVITGGYFRSKVRKNIHKHKNR